MERTDFLLKYVVAQAKKRIGPGIIIYSTFFTSIISLIFQRDIHRRVDPWGIRAYATD